MITGNSNKSNNNSFTYTLLLDDLMGPLETSSLDFMKSSLSSSQKDSPFKCFQEDCKTQLPSDSVFSGQDSVTKTKPKTSSQSSKQRLSDGPVKFAVSSRNRIPEFNFLSNSEDSFGEQEEENYFANCETFSEDTFDKKVFKSESNISVFSLSTCFQTRNLNFESNRNFYLKTANKKQLDRCVDSSRLRRALGKQHFKRATQQLSQLIENGRSIPARFF